ncbi:MAG: tRNA lysidine(34) synthetase TilS [Rhodobacteraceae bacterium]|nr:tRNA lysidine(34) synthetase TilS [Paracoccaceae bacterium]
MSEDACDPSVSDAEVDRCFSPISDVKAVALGVSGGSDSMALLRLFAEWVARNGWNGSGLVLTVDHGLRDESRAEARFVADVSAKLGFEHRTLSWDGIKPASNVQAMAREARYQLFAVEMAKSNAEVLLLGHHQDDQVETFLDRLTRGSGIYGLSAMASESALPSSKARIFRPFLEFPKQRLIASLLERDQNWCEDPSNEKSAYKRVRLRKLAQDLSTEGLDLKRLTKTAERLRRAAAAIDQWVAAFMDEYLRSHAAGPVCLPFSTFSELPEEVRLRALARLVQRVGAQDYSPRLVKLEALDQSLRVSNEHKATLATCVFHKQGGKLFVWREMGREPPETLELTGELSPIWDGRYILTGSPHAFGEERFLGPLGLFPGRQRDLGFAWPTDWPREAFDAAPAVWSEDGLHFVPGLLEDTLGAHYNCAQVLRHS